MRQWHRRVLTVAEAERILWHIIGYLGCNPVEGGEQAIQTCQHLLYNILGDAGDNRKTYF